MNPPTMNEELFKRVRRFVRHDQMCNRVYDLSDNCSCGMESAINDLQQQLVAPTPPASAPAKGRVTDPAVVEMLRRSLAEAKEGKLIDLGSFAKYADEAPVGDFPDQVRNYMLGELEKCGIKPDIDGGGCDSGDWRDFCMAEIRQGFGALTDALAEASAPRVREVSDSDVERTAAAIHESAGAVLPFAQITGNGFFQEHVAMCRRHARAALQAALVAAIGEGEAPVKDDNRCARCGWTLRSRAKDGCVRGNCSYRPEPPLMRHQFYDLQRWDREIAPPSEPKAKRGQL